ncbi:MAG TPA: DUF4157 domain-containing protein [Thermoanaerobaculia bacterium]|nr:DUF4157 domain-containing protein [Thermoanaerobaculia bacterium]
MRGGAARAISSSPAGEPTPTGGRALSAESRAFFEPRFGADFSRVRVFSDEQAGAAARSAGALAYTLGRQIVWGAPAAPESRAARPILAHELAHVAANHTAAEPSTGFRLPADPAVLPTASQREDVLEIFNRRQSEDSKIDPVTDPDAFIAALKARARILRASRLSNASAVQSSPVRLGTSDLTDVVAIAEREIRAVFSSYLATKVDLSGVRARIRYFPADPGTAPAADEATLSADTIEGLSLAAIRVGVSQDAAAQKIIEDHRVIPGGRDDALYQRALKAILDEKPDEWRKIGLSVRGVNGEDLTLIQRRIVPASGESLAQAQRRGRWMNLGTAIHEMLHAVTHPGFSDAVRGTEQGDLGVEGFTEFFTRALYEEIQARAASDPDLRLQIEGTPGPAFTPPPRTSYTDFFTEVKDILDKLGGNEENLRQAYFKGKVEYIGLGHWNELSRGLPTARRHDLGAAVLLQTKEGSLTGRPFARANYGYLLWGRSGAVQVDLRGGAGITFLGEGQRLGLGPELSLTLRGKNLFLTGGALLQGSASLAGSEGGGLRADTVFRVAAGAQIGRLHVGPGVDVLVPINEPDAARKGARVFAGIGASFVFGK